MPRISKRQLILESAAAIINEKVLIISRWML